MTASALSWVWYKPAKEDGCDGCTDQLRKDKAGDIRRPDARKGITGCTGEGYCGVGKRGRGGKPVGGVM